MSLRPQHRPEATRPTDGPGHLASGRLVLTGEATPAWTAADIAPLADGRYDQAPVITAADAQPVLEGYDLWDAWPLARLDGATAEVDGGRLWFILAAPALSDPDQRHDIARIRLLHQTPHGWRDLGDALPDGFSPGCREWSGSAVLHPDGRLTLLFTAAGRRGDACRTFEQRLFQTTGRLSVNARGPELSDWSAPVESVEADDDVYLRVGPDVGRPGHIKALRDPAYFRDPADGASYLLFAASLKRSDSDYNGALGVARTTDKGLTEWRLEPPLLHADGLNNELERPHAIFRDGLYYVFWCTQRHVFAPATQGPTGLYGVVGETLRGPYRRINGTGLVFANPLEEPRQAYAWWVTAEGEAIGFVDRWGLQGREPGPGRVHFGGTPAPAVRLSFNGDRVGLR